MKAYWSSAQASVDCALPYRSLPAGGRSHFWSGTSRHRVKTLMSFFSTGIAAAQAMCARAMHFWRGSGKSFANRIQICSIPCERRGARDLTFDMMLTEAQLETYEAQPEDEELTIVTSRRTTLELAMREYVEGLPNVNIRSSVFVRRLITETKADGVIKVTGVSIGTEEQTDDLFADMIVDASGKSGFLIEQLRDDGAAIEEESETAGILYFTRHYRLLPGVEEPSRSENPPGTGDLGYLKFGVFPGDNGCFSITISVPEVEMELRKAIMNPETFHAITLQLPGLKPWTNSERAKPRGKVYGMGDLHKPLEEPCHRRKTERRRLLSSWRHACAHQSTLWPGMLLCRCQRTTARQSL